MIFFKFMIQVDGLIYVGNIVEEVLIEETRRVSILQRMFTFIPELLGRRRFARPSGAPNRPIVYTRRAWQPLDMEFEAV